MVATPTIPPNATLNFEVELLRWKSVKDITGNGGIIKTIVTKGAGFKKPNDIDEVTVKYMAKTADGTVLKQTPDEGITFKVSDGDFCAAVSKTVLSMESKEEVSCVCSGEYVEGVEGLPLGESMTLDLTLLAIHTVEMVSGQDCVKKTLVEGEGYDRPNDGAKVGVRYTATLPDGTVFDKVEGDDLCSWVVDEEQQIIGLDKAVLKMKKGEKALITIRPELAFGAQDTVKPLATIPANTTVQYEMELVEIEKAKEVWSMSTEEKFSFFEEAKAQGNTLFKEGKFQRAIKKYGKALSTMESDHSFTDEEKTRAKKAKLPLHLNKAAVQLKLGEWAETRGSCGKALEIEPNNTKALFRRAQAHSALEDPDLACQDLKLLLEHDASNKDAMRELRRVKEKLKEQYRKEAKIFGNMFQRMSDKAGDLYDLPSKNEFDPKAGIGEENLDFAGGMGEAGGSGEEEENKDVPGPPSTEESQ
mmetsp:Transcript_20256/g.28042  ORF Transcript_20256/g.28042 Transcript_20256/m.28042 type:complete len:474 (+) Transcript_20256:2-1423(+)